MDVSHKDTTCVSSAVYL